MPLDMTYSVEGNTARLTLSGQLDASSAPTVRQAVDNVLGGAPSRLLLEVEHLNFMASAGLRILIFAKQKQPYLRIYLIKPQPTIIDTLQKTGFYQSVYVTEGEIEDDTATR